MADKRFVLLAVIGKYKLLGGLIDIPAAGRKKFGVALALFKFSNFPDLDRALYRGPAARAHHDAVQLAGVDEIVNAAGLGRLGAGGIIVAHRDELRAGMMLVHIVAEALFP